MTFAAMAALILAAGCAKIENKSTTNDVQHAIGFSNYAPRNLTKADGTYASSTTLANGKVYDVYAYATGNGIAFTTTAIGTQFMNGVHVTYTTGGDSDPTKNAYSPTRYWPSGDAPQWLTFWAYYPVQSGNGITYTAPDGGNGLGSYAFTAAASAASMVDFMVSDVVNDKIYGTAEGEHIAVNGIVPLKFHHQLTKIIVKIVTDKNDDCTNVVLTDAKLYNIKTTGTLSATAFNSSTGAITTSWGSLGTPASYDITDNGNDFNNTLLVYNTPVGGQANDVFLMVPQETIEPAFSTTPHIVANLSNTPQYILITWDVKTYDNSTNAATNGAEGLLSTTSNSQAIYLDNVVVKDGSGDPVSNNDWAINQQTTYTITIGPKPIKFTASVQGWADETFGNITVM